MRMFTAKNKTKQKKKKNFAQEHLKLTTKFLTIVSEEDILTRH